MKYPLYTVIHNKDTGEHTRIPVQNNWFRIFGKWYRIIFCKWHLYINDKKII